MQRLILLLSVSLTAGLAVGPVPAQVPAAFNDRVITGETLPEEAAGVLQEIMRRSGVFSVRVTSTVRTPLEQARVMLGYIERHGTGAAYRLYGPEGDAVIAAYERAADADGAARLEVMHREVVRQLPAAHANGRLMHTNDSHYVFDVAMRSVAQGRRAAFVRTARAHPRVTRFMGPTDGEREAFHLEVPKPPADKP